MTEYSKEFEQLVRDADIPVTPEEYQSEWDAINTSEGSIISNDSQWSPFWQLISAIVTAPAVKLSQFLIGNLLPNVYLKTASGQYLDLFADGRDVVRYPATKLQGKVLFKRINETSAQIVEKGVIIQTPPINNIIFEIVTIEDIVFTSGETEKNVTVEAVKPGSDSNLAPGYYSILAETVENIISVSTDTDWIIAPGTDTESDDNLRQRVRNKFTAVGRWHHDAAYKSIISEYAKIPVDYIWFEHGAPRGPGSANAYIMTESGAPSQSYIDSINAYIDESGEHGHGDDLFCFPIPLQNINLSPVVYLDGLLSSETKESLLVDIENMVRCAFRQNSEYKSFVTQAIPFVNFSFSRLSEELHNHFSKLVSVEFKHDDIQGGLFLPHLETLAITER